MGEILWIISYVVLGLAIIPFLILTLSVGGLVTFFGFVYIIAFKFMWYFIGKAIIE